MHEAVELRAKVLRVGGKDDSVPVLLLADEGDVRGQTNRATAKDLARHLFDDVIVHGDGTWLRDSHGKWTLEVVKIAGWHPAPATQEELPLSSDALLQSLRAIGGNGWDDFDDPLAELRRLRGG